MNSKLFIYVATSLINMRYERVDTYSVRGSELYQSHLIDIARSIHRKGINTKSNESSSVIELSILRKKLKRMKPRKRAALESGIQTIFNESSSKSINSITEELDKLARRYGIDKNIYRLGYPKSKGYDFADYRKRLEENVGPHKLIPRGVVAIHHLVEEQSRLSRVSDLIEGVHYIPNDSKPHSNGNGHYYKK